LSLLKRDGLNRYEFEKTMTMSIGYVTAWRLTLPSYSCRLSIVCGLFLQHKPHLGMTERGLDRRRGGMSTRRGGGRTTCQHWYVLLLFSAIFFSSSLWFLFSGLLIFSSALS
jgi:hypothetical protein